MRKKRKKENTQHTLTFFAAVFAVALHRPGLPAIANLAAFRVLRLLGEGPVIGLFVHLGTTDDPLDADQINLGLFAALELTHDLINEIGMLQWK